MSVFETIKRSIKYPEKIPMNLLYRMPISRRLSDETYLKFVYWTLMHEKLDLDNPITFNEKLQWLKLHDRNPLYTTLVDKLLVKDWVTDQIGAEHVVSTLAVWDCAEDIDISNLPNQFVLKTNHDSGGVVVCRDKSSFDLKAAKRKLTKHLSRNYYWVGREWPYKNVIPKIFAERYIVNAMNDDSEGSLQSKKPSYGFSSSLTDYKFYCFGGTPEFLYVSSGLENHATARISFLTNDWEFMPFSREDFASFEELPPKPEHLDAMRDVARRFSQGIPFVRVDFFEASDTYKVSEMTFTPCGGFMPLKPREFDFALGNRLDINLRVMY